jgi:hypothetical protein
MKNPISFEIPKLIFDECFLISDNNLRTFKKLGSFDESLSSISVENHMRFFNIFNTISLYSEAFNYSKTGSIYSTLRMLSKSNSWSFGEMSWLHVADPLIKQIALMHFHHQKFHKKYYQAVVSNEKDTMYLQSFKIPSVKLNSKKGIDLSIVDYANRDPMISSIFRSNTVYDP